MHQNQLHGALTKALSPSQVKGDPHILINDLFISLSL